MNCCLIVEVVASTERWMLTGALEQGLWPGHYLSRSSRVGCDDQARTAMLARRRETEFENEFLVHLDGVIRISTR